VNLERRRRWCWAVCVWFCYGGIASASVPPHPSGAEIANALEHLSLDPAQTYHVRELELSRGGANLYLTEGILAFASPVCGRTIAAVFTTSGVEAGDAEIVLMPPQRNERASLASFAGTPNLDEHFTSALLLFSDNTAEELKAQMGEHLMRKASEQASELTVTADQLFRSASTEMEVPLVQALLGGKPPGQGFFYIAILGRNVGPFDILYQPDEFEPFTLGRFKSDDGNPRFELWTAFRPRQAPAYRAPAPAVRDYQIDATIHEDLRISAKASLHLIAPPESGRVLAFRLSDRLRVVSAALDGEAVEVLQRSGARTSAFGGENTFLLIADKPFIAGSQHSVQIQYEGSVIRKLADGRYAVDDRSAWYPFMPPTFARFDLTFHCPEQLRVVSTGERVSEKVENGERVVRRIATAPEHVAGFNLGEYRVVTDEHPPYHVECYADAAMQASQGGEDPLALLIRQTENILDYYTRQFGLLPIHHLAISPVPGYFGQGFPGLIYLSALSYLPEEQRPAALRGPRLDSFFSDLLLPHEVAHQWWGNIVTAGDYRTAWLIESLAEDSALQYLQSMKGPQAVDAVLERYREDLLEERNGRSIEAAGPIDFGVRLLNTAGFEAWERITYEKGAWILRMLRERLGDKGFDELRSALIQQYSEKTITNEEFRRLASSFVPRGQPDPSLSDFFDTWVYGTGIPTLRLRIAGRSRLLEVSGVDEDFSADIPLHCKSESGREQTHWVHASLGTNDLPPADATCELPSPSTFLYRLPNH